MFASTTLRSVSRHSEKVGQDGAGNQTCDTDPNGAIRTYGYDAANQIASITMTGSSQPFETYVYNATGSRVRKTNADGTFTEYVDFGGQPIAQKDQTGNWTDYIYANGKQIAQIAPADTAVHMHGTTTCITCGQIYASWFFSDPLENYVVKPGDKISWRQYQSGTVQGGLHQGWFWNCGGFYLSDTSGQPMGTSNVQNAWQQRTVDLSSMAGCRFQTFRLGLSSATATGDWDMWFADMALYSSDGTVIPIMYRQSPISPDFYEAANVTNYSIGIDSTTVPAGALSDQNTVAYTLSDHLGTAQMTFSGGGWPVWKGEFSPFGQELDTQYTPNNFKFTGKERDTESGLDYFGARYYGSSMGRMMSPDPLMASAKVWDPQTWNRYAYARNNPLTYIDPTGMAEVNAADCAKDKACVTVNVNVIYDKNANGGKGISDSQKAGFEKNQLQNAKDQYGNADIHLNVTYTAGEITSKGNLTGVDKGSLNVFVTDSGGPASASSGGYALSRINVNSSNNDDLSHEMAHHFMGDMSSALGRTLSQDPTGISRTIDNMFTDVTNDTGRAIMNHVTPHLPNYPSGAPMSVFNPQARDFQNRITPQTHP